MGRRTEVFMAKKLPHDWFRDKLRGMPARALLLATGNVSPEDMEKPFIGLVSFCCAES